MTKEQYNLLGAKLTQSYKNKAKNSSSGGVGLIRAIVGADESDQGYLHLEEFYIRGNTITLENYLNAVEVKFEALNSELETLKENYKQDIKERDKKLEELEKELAEVKQTVAEFNLSILE